jgi:hypothetical protein
MPYQSWFGALQVSPAVRCLYRYQWPSLI